MRWLIGLAGGAAAALALVACASISGLSSFENCTDKCGDATTSSSGGGHHGDGSAQEDGGGLDAPVATEDGGCTGGQIACEGGCIDPDLPSNCGSCGTTCSGATPLCAPTGSTFACSASCPGTMVACNGSCSDTTSDPDNCGGCAGDGGTVCTTSVANATPACVNSACAVQCSAGFNLCNGACVAFNTADNCGGCGISCEGGTPVCTSPAEGQNYSCGSGCQDSGVQVVCNGACVDITSTATNCGGCATADGGNVCTTSDPNGQPACVNSACTVSCNEGYTLCNGSCVQLNTSTNCGFCGVTCSVEAGAPVCVAAPDGGTEAGAAALCSSGCNGGETLCGGSCVDEQSDLNNCGSCGNKCTTSVANAAATCSGGGCGFACNTGSTKCGSACVDTTSDKNNCGSCGHECLIDAGTPNCSNSTCVSGCATGQSNCSGACVNEQIDPNNCGSCGHKCTTNVGNATASCSAGICGFTCNTNYTACNGACVNEQTDKNNCGGCGSSHACASGLSCENATCTCVASGCPNDCLLGVPCCNSNNTCGCNGLLSSCH